MTFSLASLVSPERRYSESDSPRYYAGLHTPIYRVLNALESMILDARLSRHFEVNTTRGFSKSIYHVSGLLVAMQHGYSVVKLGARVIFAIDENTRTIYELDEQGNVASCDYRQGYDMTDVIAQVVEAFEVIAERCNVLDSEFVAPEPKAPITWELQSRYSFGDKPEFKSYTGRTVEVSVLLLTESKKSYKWHHRYVNASNRYDIREDRGSLPTAYKVEIGGVSAWLPQSIMGYDRVLRYDLHSKHPATISVPAWWYKKNIAPSLSN